MLPPDAKIFDLLKLFSKDVIASIIKPIVASLRGAGVGGGGGFARYQGPLFSVPAVGEDLERSWEKGDFGARGVEERERLHDAIVYTKPTKTLFS